MTGITLPENLSYSQKNSLGDCAGRYYLEKGQRVPQRPAWANVGGTAAHSTTQELDERLYGAGEHIDSLDTIRDIFMSYFEQETVTYENVTKFDRSEFRASGRASRQWPDKETHLWWHEQGPLMSLAWVRFRDAFPYQIATVDKVDPETGEVVPSLGIELECRPTLAGLPIHAFVDRLFVRETADGPEHLVLDLKFGSREPSSGDQLDTYRIGILQDYGIDPKWGNFWMGRKAMSTQSYDLHATPIARVEYDYKMAHEQRMRGDFRYHPSNLCNGCSVNAYCPVFGGQYADTIPQPWELDEPVSLRPPTVRV